MAQLLVAFQSLLKLRGMLGFICCPMHIAILVVLLMVLPDSWSSLSGCCLELDLCCCYSWINCCCGILTLILYIGIIRYVVVLVSALMNLPIPALLGIFWQFSLFNSLFQIVQRKHEKIL
jgi:hypothetical protein